MGSELVGVVSSGRKVLLGVVGGRGCVGCVDGVKIVLRLWLR